MEKPKRSKKPLAIVLIVLIVLMLIPIPFRILDAGVCWRAVLYKVWQWDCMPEPVRDGQGGYVTDEQGGYKYQRLTGTSVEIPGFLDEGLTIIDATRWVPVEPSD